MTPGTSAAGNLALYRKYRSATFAEVIGQEHVTGPLRAALSAGRINHAYLFSGPRGCGKTSSARILARSLNCAQGPTPDPCGECDSCRELAPNGSGSIDVIEIDAASHNGVDDARDLRERALFAPVRDRYKVYIVDEAHMVTTAAFNALLKLVEEPPDFVVFVFATTEPDKVLTTIRSRTHHYPFRLIAPGTMRTHLEGVCAAEGIAVEPAVLPLVVRSGGGSARDSLSILDQLLAGAGSEGVTYAHAVGLLGVTDAALLDDIVDALAAGDAAAVYETIDGVAEAGHDPRRFSGDLLDRFRDLILLDAVPDAADRGLVDAPQDQLAHMAEQTARLGGASLARFAEIVHTALIEMRGTTSPRLVLELLCARMLLPDAGVDSAAVLQRLERLERRMSVSPSVAPAPDAKPTSAPAPAPAPDAKRSAVDAKRSAADPEPSAATVPPVTTARPKATVPPAAQSPDADLPATQPSASQPSASQPSAAQPSAAQPSAAQPSAALDATGLRRIWPEVLNVIGAASRTIRALLEGSQVLEAEGEAVTIGVAPGLAKRLAEDRNTAAVAAGLTQVVGGSWRVSVTPNTSALASDDASAAPGPRRRNRPAEPDPRDEAGYEPEPASGDGPGSRGATPPDPEAEALKLLQDKLGARPLEA